MEERNIEGEKMDEVLLPGFRFHPTDEELVGFYLKKKIQQRPLSIELIKQLDIYKYDPWDLPKLATTGEKEWYFYCPRDRKYRNSARPNRVTGAGFWKATGTDRPIYSSEGSSKCIGLKKSLVFYKGKAAKGIKTDWMMHEFRLPSLTESSAVPHNKRFIDKTIPANDSWAICRIFKKTNSTAQRALSHSWVSAETTNTNTTSYNNTHFSSDNMSSLTAAKTASSSIPFNFDYVNEMQQSSSSTTSPTSFFPLDFVSYKPIYSQIMPSSKSPHHNHHLLPNISTGDYLSTSFMSSPFEPSVVTSTPAANKCNIDVSSMLLNMSSSMLGDFSKASNHHHHHPHQCVDFIGDHHIHQSQQQCNNNGFSSNTLPHEMHVNNISNNIPDDDHESVLMMKNQNVDQWDDQTVRSLGSSFPFGYLPMSVGADIAWKPSSLWDSSSCPTEMSTSTVSTTKCYT